MTGTSLQPPQRAFRGHERLVPALLIAALVGVPLLLSIITGAWAIPHNDAWSHSKIAEIFAETGRVELVGWNRSALVGQIVVLGPLGGSIIAQHLAVAMWAAVALTSIYLILSPRIGRTLSLWTLAAIGVTAEFALLSTSFMTDIPMLAGVMASLAMLDRATGRGSLGWFAGAVASALWATTVRDTAVAALVAVVLIGAVTWSGRRRALALLMGGGATAALLAFQLWRRSLPDNDTPWLEFTPGLTVKSLLLAGMACGLLLAPIILLVVAPRTWPRRSWVAGALVLVLGLAWVGLRGADAVFGNYLTTQGSYPTVFATTPQVLPASLLVTVAVLGAGGAALMAGHLIERPPSMDRNATAFALLLTATTFGPSLLSQEIFARGVLPLVPFLAVLLARDRVRRRVILPAAVLAALTGLGLLVALQAMAFDVARWTFAESLVEQGWPATAIDAGLEWNGTHADGPFTLGDPLAVCPNPGATQQGVTITAERVAQDSVAEWAYRTFAVGPTSTLYAVTGPPCGG